MFCIDIIHYYTMPLMSLSLNEIAFWPLRGGGGGGGALVNKTTLKGKEGAKSNHYGN